MDNEIVTKINQAAESQDWDTAVGLIEDLVKQSISDEEVGEALVTLTTLYIGAINSLNNQYIEALKRAKAELLKINSSYQQEADDIELSFTRSQIQSSQEEDPNKF